MAKEEGPTPKRPHFSRYRELIADSPEHLLKLVERLYGQAFYFRGHTNTDWKLATTLERRYDAMIRHVEEQRILYEFQRRAPTYTDDLPAAGDQLEWLAVLRHFGGPTRFLDFTTSPFIAAFFAVSLSKGEGDAAIWAINRAAVNHGASLFIAHHQHPTSVFAGVGSHDGTSAPLTDATASLHWPFLCYSAVDRALSHNVSDCAVFPVEPRRLNRRMQSQKTVFLAPLNVRKSFIENLCAMLDPGIRLDSAPKPEHLKDQDSLDMYSNDGVLKIIIPKQAFKRFHTALREMNLSEATLFPDLEGLIRSLLPISREWGFPSTRSQ